MLVTEAFAADDDDLEIPTDTYPLAHDLLEQEQRRDEYQYSTRTKSTTSLDIGGIQCIHTVDGYVIPHDIINGLPHMKMQPNTDKQLEELPHVILTSNEPWDPRVLDNSSSSEDDWYNTIKELHDGLIKTPLDKYGN